MILLFYCQRYSLCNVAVPAHPQTAAAHERHPVPFCTPYGGAWGGGREEDAVSLVPDPRVMAY